MADPGTLDDPFTISVAKYIERAKGMAQAALQATAMDALARVQQLTPVKTGNLRANWQVTPASDAVPLLGARQQDGMTVIASLKLGDSFVISNPVPYARRIEYGFVGFDSLGRRYNQQGVGMMTQTITELPQIAAAATRRVMQQ